MALEVQFTCPVCRDAITVPLKDQMLGIGLFMSHLIGEHWEAVEQMRASLGTVEPGAWKRIAADLPRT